MTDSDTEPYYHNQPGLRIYVFIFGLEERRKT